MVAFKLINIARLTVALCLLGYLSIQTALASSWQDEPDARTQLHQLGLELALADVHPKLTQWWQQAATPSTASDAADDRLLLGIQSFWRYWQQLPFEDRQHLKTTAAELSVSEADREYLRLVGEQQARGELLASLAPSYANYPELRQQLARLLKLRDLPWPALRTTTVRPGERLPVIESIRERLALLGDLPKPQQPSGQNNLLDRIGSSNEFIESEQVQQSSFASSEDTYLLEPELYDQALEAGVRQFQKRHGLTVDGVIGPQTYAWLDVSPLRRSQLLMRSQMRTLISDTLPESYLLVNIPEYYMRLYQDDVMVLESNVIVGRDQRKTPVMASEITHVVFNPPWNVPRSIINRDIVPKLYRDPGYIERMGFEVLDGERVVPSYEWLTRLEEGGGFPYRLRQRPGRSNSLGAFKFHLPVNNAIYLHDTPARSLFTRDSRAFSSGCVRVEGAEQLAQWLLQDQLSSARFNAFKNNPNTRWVKVVPPLPLRMVYWASWLGENGLPQYRNDIYDFEQRLNDPFTG